MIGVIAILSVLLLVSNIFWSFVCFNLVNRLMSRNFFEFKQAKSVGKAKEPDQKPADELVIDPIDEQQAREMNSIIGVI